MLRRAIAAADTLRYSGRRTVVVLKEGERLAHEEIVLKDGPRLRIEFPSGSGYAGQVVVETAKERRHFLPGPNEVRVLSARGEEGLRRLRALARAGAVTTAPGERICGFPTVEATIRDAAGNPLQRLAISPASGLVLRRRVYDATGVEVGGYVFTKVALDPPPFDPALFRIERKGVRRTTPWDALRRLAKKSGFAARGLPESSGYRLDGVRLAKLPEGDVLVQNYIGPGGRLTLDQLRESVDPDRLRRQGGRRLGVVSWTEGDIVYVLIGPQDAATLDRLRRLVAPAP